MTAKDCKDELPACPEWPSEPWILRQVPEHLRPCFLYVGAQFGMLCDMAMVLSSLAGLTALPLMMAAYTPDAWISRVVLWFYGLTGPDWFLPIYTAIMISVLLLIFSGMQLSIFIRVRYGNKYFDMPRKRRDV